MIRPFSRSPVMTGFFVFKIGVNEVNTSLDLTSEEIEARRAYNRKTARRYRERHRARVNANARKWRENNPDKVDAIEKRYWAKRAAALKKNQES